MKSIEKMDLESSINEPFCYELEDDSFDLDLSKPIHERVVVRAICKVKDKYAFVHISRDDDFGKLDYLETSGGGVEDGEDLEEALKRELREELGYVIKPIKYLGVIKDYYNLINRRNINHYFLVEAIDEVETSLTEDEKNKFHLSKVLVSLEEAIKVYEQIKNTKLGRLVYRREIIPLTYVKTSLAFLLFTYKYYIYII